MAKGWESEDLEPSTRERVISKRQYWKPPRDEERCQALTTDKRSVSGKHRCEKRWKFVTKDGRRLCTVHYRIRDRIEVVEDGA